MYKTMGQLRTWFGNNEHLRLETKQRTNRKAAAGEGNQKEEELDAAPCVYFLTYSL